MVYFNRTIINLVAFTFLKKNRYTASSAGQLNCDGLYKHYDFLDDGYINGFVPDNEHLTEFYQVNQICNQSMLIVQVKDQIVLNLIAFSFIFELKFHNPFLKIERI